MGKICYCYYFLPFDTIHTCSFASIMPNTGCKHLGSPFLLCAIHVFQILLSYLNVNSILMIYYQIHVGCFIDLMKLLIFFTKICTTGLFRKLVHFYNRTSNWQKYIVVEFFLVYLEKYMYLLLYYRGILKCINCFTNGIGIPICLLKTQWKFKSIYRMYFYLFFVIQL